MDKHDNHPTKPPEQKKLIQKDGKYWRSLEEHNLAPDALVEVEPEFADSPIREGNEETDEGRREFLKLMAASAVMLSASACSRRPVEKIIPYVKHPEGITPGIANYYASTCGECSTGCGVIVKTREGRPIKLEGNSEHPLSGWVVRTRPSFCFKPV